MKKILAALALTLTMTQPAHAYLVSCGDFKAAFTVGDNEVQAAVAGHSFGVVDMLATLDCFVRDRRCTCLSTMEARPEAYAEALVNRIMACPNGNTAAGAAFNAALDVCQ